MREETYDDVGLSGGVAGKLERCLDRLSATGVYRENYVFCTVLGHTNARQRASNDITTPPRQAVI